MAPKDKESGPEFKVDPSAWMATFADLVMLLLTFFVLLLTMKSMDSGKGKRDVRAHLRPAGFYSGVESNGGDA